MLIKTRKRYNLQYYEMNTAQKDCLDTFMMARNQDLVWGKANVDEYGKPKIYEDETGRPIVSGDGIVAQIERFASKFVFSKLNVKYIDIEFFKDFFRLFYCFIK